MAAFGATILYRELYDIPFQHLGQRYGNLVFTLFCAAFIFAMTRKPFRPASNGSQPPLAADRST